MPRKSIHSAKARPIWEAEAAVPIRPIKFRPPIVTKLEKICADKRFRRGLEAAAGEYCWDAQIGLAHRHTLLPADLMATLLDLQARVEVLANVVNSLPVHPLGNAIELACFRESGKPLPALWVEPLFEELRTFQHRLSVTHDSLSNAKRLGRPSKTVLRRKLAERVGEELRRRGIETSRSPHDAWAKCVGLVFEAVGDPVGTPEKLLAGLEEK